MSTALAIPGVTAVLRHFLNSVYNNVHAVLGSVNVSAKAPDIVQTELGNGPHTPLTVNLFLHQVTPNAAWRNMGLPSLASDGITVLKNRPLALDLHYLLTAYASEDNHAEALLSYAVSFLHDNPVFPRGQVSAALTALPADPFSDGLLASGLADQVEMIKITPATLGREEMAWLWTALKADYRPTFPFQATVVLVEPQNPLTEALPVLQRVVAAQPNLLSPLPTITEADPPKQQPAAVLGDVVTVLGYSLAKVNAVLLINSLRGVEQTIAVPPHPSDTSFQFTVPPPQPNPTDIPVGVYLLSAQAPAPPDTLRSNSIAFAIA